MATASDIARAGLQRILVEADEAPLTASEYADFYSAMNDYMASLEAQGVKLGYTPVTGAADTVTVPAGALRGIIANVAIEVAPDYGGNVTPALMRQAQEGLQVMRQLGQQIITARFPGTLPMGSGSEQLSGWNSHYYMDQVSGRLSLAGNTEVTAFTATNTPVRINGFWQVEAAAGLQGDITGAMANVADGPVDLDVKATLTCTGNSTYTFRLMRNGVSQASTTAAVTATPTSVTLAGFITLNPSDFIEVFVEDDSATADLVVGSAQVVFS